jgi:hypothetical protein
MSVILGQHIGDDMISFCRRSPGGFDLEYVRHERLVVDNAAWAPRLFNVAAAHDTRCGNKHAATTPPSAIYPLH